MASSSAVMHISKANRLKAEQKIERKIQGLERYVINGQADFEIPKKFTLNWFCALASDPYERVAKGGEQLRTGAAMHKRVSEALARAQEVLEGARTHRGICKKTERIKQLEDRVKKAEALIPGLTQNIADLLEEVEDLTKRLGLEQARWADQKHNVSRIR